MASCCFAIGAAPTREDDRTNRREKPTKPRVSVLPVSATAVSIGHNVRERAEIDGVMAQAAAAGAEIVKPAQETFYGGYAGYFLDPDRHLWEVVWNPEFLSDE